MTSDFFSAFENDPWFKEHIIIDTTYYTPSAEKETPAEQKTKEDTTK